MKTIRLKLPNHVPADHISVQFLQGMVDRMAQGFSTYGHMKENFPMRVDALKSADIRRKQYRKTHNLEFLMDEANFLMCEFARPKDPAAHFTPTDSDKSPGVAKRFTHTIVRNKREICE